MSDFSCFVLHLAEKHFVYKLSVRTHLQIEMVKSKSNENVHNSMIHLK